MCTCHLNWNNPLWVQVGHLDPVSFLPKTGFHRRHIMWSPHVASMKPECWYKTRDAGCQCRVRARMPRARHTRGWVDICAIRLTWQTEARLTSNLRYRTWSQMNHVDQGTHIITHGVNRGVGTHNWTSILNWHTHMSILYIISNTIIYRNLKYGDDICQRPIGGE